MGYNILKYAIGYFSLCVKNGISCPPAENHRQKSGKALKMKYISDNDFLKK